VYKTKTKIIKLIKITYILKTKYIDVELKKNDVERRNNIITNDKVLI